MKIIGLIKKYGKTVTGIITGVAGTMLGWFAATEELIPYLKTLAGLGD